jgi:glutamate racemase
MAPTHQPSSGSSLPCDAPIGVFDSGIGGLSVLQALRALLPQEDFIYLADSGHAPMANAATPSCANAHST